MISSLDRFIDKIIRLEELKELFIASYLEYSQLLRSKLVHKQGSNETGLDSKAPVDACTVETQEYAIVD